MRTTMMAVRTVFFVVVVVKFVHMLVVIYITVLLNQYLAIIQIFPILSVLSIDWKIRRRNGGWEVYLFCRVG